MNKGVRYMLIATFTFAVMNLFVKFVRHIPAVEIILFRSVVSFIVSLVMLTGQRINIWGNNKVLLILRGTVGAIALIMFFMLLQQVPLAAASTLGYLAPVFTTIIGIFLVREKVNPIQWFFFAVSFGGILVIQGFDSRIGLNHLFLGIGSTFFMGLAYNLIRKLNTTEHPLVIIIYFPLVTIPIVTLISVFNWVQPVGWDWLILFLIGLLTQVAQFYMTKSYQSESLSRVSIINYTGIVYSLSFGYIFFNESFNLLTYLGMAMVILGVLLNLFVKKRTQNGTR